MVTMVTVTEFLTSMLNIVSIISEY